jgi:heme A synthase
MKPIAATESRPVTHSSATPRAAGHELKTSRWTRWFHRWVSIAFTLTVIANFVAMTQGTPPPWITYAPLLPLALLLFTGLYLFALPYLRRARPRHETDERASSLA